MRISDIARAWFFARCGRLLLAADNGGGTGAGDGAAAAAPEGNGFDAALLRNLPGGEMLNGAVANRPEAAVESRIGSRGMLRGMVPFGGACFWLKCEI